MPAYLTNAEADTIAAALPASLLTAWAAASAPNKTAALEQATADVDAAGPYQGRRYKSEADGQALEFPRVAYAQGPGVGGQESGVIWDWDATAKAAVVPLNVKRAVVYQANAILSGEGARLLDARHGGLASQSVGGVSESYVQGSGVGGQGSGSLSRRAADLLRGYRLRTGRLL